MTAQELAARADGLGIFVEDRCGSVVEVRRSDCGRDTTGRYCTIFEWPSSDGGNIRVASVCDAPEDWSSMARLRLQVDEAFLWEKLLQHGLMPWTAYYAGGDAIYPGATEYGRYAATDTFHTISG